MTDTKDTFLLVDGHSLAYRAFYAYLRGSEGGLRTSKGIPTSVCYGFLKALLEVLEKEQPKAAAVAFDTRMPTFRHDVDDTYKAGRPETPQEFIEDLQNLKEILSALQIPRMELPGYEADDLLGSLAQQGVLAGYKVKILSGDQDLFQLVDREETIRVLYQSSQPPGIREFGPEQIKEKLGVWPEQVVDYKALCGDTSDNIPGVKGIGAKTAIKLLEEFNSVEGIYQHLDQIKGATKTKLEAGQDAALHSYWMATIHRDAPMAADITQCRLTGFLEEDVRPLLEHLEFTSFLRQVKRLQTAFSKGSEQQAEIEKQEAADDELWFGFQDQPRLDIQVTIVDSAEKLEQFLEALKKLSPETILAFDTETTSLDVRQAQLVGIGCSWQEEQAYYFPLGHLEGQNYPPSLEALKPILEDSHVPKAFQNAKYDRLILLNHNIHLQGVVFDPMLASYTLNPETEHNLAALSIRYLKTTMPSYQELVGKKKTIAEVPIANAAHYCGMDAVCTQKLVPLLKAELAQSPTLEKLFYTLELPLEPVLADMEWQGIRIDKAYLAQLSEELTRDLKTLEERAYELVGEPFNLNSPKQLSDILFEKLKLDSRKSKKTTLGYSTNVQVLEKLQGDHPLIDTILENRTLSKLKSTYVDALPELVNPTTHRVHTDFNQAVTTTGRLSSSHPNLQNIPIRTEFSRRVRSAFIPEENGLLVSADYSQIEFRILAHVSQEIPLVQAFNTGEDVHALTAKLLLEKTEVTKEERRLGKTLNYGVIYGMGSDRFAREAGVSRAEAKKFLDGFYERYPKVFAYLKQTEKMALEKEYVETIFGRRRYFPNLAKQPTNQRLALLRAATNAPIQGTAADIIKMAMLRVHEALKPYQSRLLLQVHDELVFEVPKAEWEEVQTIIRTSMEQAVTLSVPLSVDISAGVNWKEAK
jgi:DNA polymerase I